MLREFSPDLQHPCCVRITIPALVRTPPNDFLLTAARQCAEIEAIYAQGSDLQRHFD